MAEPALAYEPDNYYTDIPVGEILRRARLHYGQSLADIERNLRIRAGLIEAIEKGDSSKLPGRVYAIGFVRSYAEYLGLNGEKMVQLFKTQSVGVTEKPELNFPVAASDSKMPSLKIVAMSSALALMLVIGWGVSNAIDRSDVTEVSSVPSELEDRLAMENGTDISQKEFFGPPAPSMTATDAAAIDPAAGTTIAPEAETATATATPATVPATTEEPGIILNITENSWVEIKDGTGKAIVSRVLKAGDQYFVPDRPDLTMSIGNAAGVELVIDGQKLKSLGKNGQIRRNIPLDSKALKASL